MNYICARCLEEKPKIEFTIDRATRRGIKSYCKECSKMISKLWRLANPDKVKEISIRWVINNPDKYKENYKKSNQKNAGKRKEWVKNNKEKVYASSQKYKTNPINKLKRNDYLKKRLKNDIRFKIKNKISCAIKDRLRNKRDNKPFNKLLPLVKFSSEELISMLESKFKENMSWNNYGDWHVDHIKPDCMFDYKTHEDKSFHESWSLDNLQPLWKEENISKGTKYYG